MKYLAETADQSAQVVVLEIKRPPYNYLNVEVLSELADRLERLDTVDDCRAVVLAADGKAFSAGADFNSPTDDSAMETATFYEHAMRLFQTKKPIIAAVHGAAVGAGLGLAVAADFRVSCEEARFSANFNRLGFHPGFGLSLTLPRLVGTQHASMLLYTGRRINGSEAKQIGLVDILVPPIDVRNAAINLAKEIAGSAPLAVESTRATLRDGFPQAIRAANQRELSLQRVQFGTEDFKEGVAAMTERRAPVFQRR